MTDTALYLSRSVQSAGSSTRMSSGAVLPEAGNSFTDARNVADAFHMIMVLSPGIRIRMQTSGRHSSSTLLKEWAWERPAAGFQ